MGSSETDQNTERVLRDLKSILDERGMAQKDFAAAIKVSPNTVHRWLTGESSPRDSNLRDIVEFLDRDTDHLKAVVAVEVRSKHGDFGVSPEPKHVQAAFDTALEGTGLDHNDVFGLQQQVGSSGSIVMLAAFNRSLAVEFAQEYTGALRRHGYFARTGISVGPLRRATSNPSGVTIYGEGPVDALRIKNATRSFGKILVDHRYRHYAEERDWAIRPPDPGSLLEQAQPVPDFGVLLDEGEDAGWGDTGVEPAEAAELDPGPRVIVTAKHTVTIDLDGRAADKQWEVEIVNDTDTFVEFDRALCVPARNIILDAGIRSSSSHSDLMSEPEVLHDLPLIRLTPRTILELQPRERYEHKLEYSVSNYFIPGPTSYPSRVRRSRFYYLPWGLRKGVRVEQWIDCEYRFSTAKLGLEDKGLRVQCTAEDRSIGIEGEYTVLKIRRHMKSDRYTTFDIIVR